MAQHIPHADHLPRRAAPAKRARRDSGPDSSALQVLRDADAAVKNIPPATVVCVPGEYWQYDGTYWGMVVCRGPLGQHVVYFPDGLTIELMDDDFVASHLRPRGKASKKERNTFPLLQHEMPPSLARYWLQPLRVPMDDGAPKAGKASSSEGLLVGFDTTSKEAIVYLKPSKPTQIEDWFHILRVSEKEARRDLPTWQVGPPTCIASMPDFPSVVDGAEALAGGAVAGVRPPTSRVTGIAVKPGQSLAQAVRAADVDLGSISKAAKLPWRWVDKSSDPAAAALKGVTLQAADRHAWQFPDPLYKDGSKVLVVVSNTTFPDAERAKLSHDRGKCQFLLRFASRLSPLADALLSDSATQRLWKVVLARHGDSTAPAGQAGAGAPADPQASADDATLSALNALKQLLSVAPSMFFFCPASLAQLLLMVYIVHKHFDVDYQYEKEMRVFGVNVTR